jgi:hypothetical protein
LGLFNTILYENEFQNPQIFQQTISLFPEHSTLAAAQTRVLLTKHLFSCRGKKIENAQAQARGKSLIVLDIRTTLRPN